MAEGTHVAWQSSLFGTGEPRPDEAFATATHHDLGDGAWVEHAPGWLAGSDDLFSQLLDQVPWGARRRWMYDRQVVEPRLTAWWSLDADADAGDEPGVVEVPAVVRALGRALGSRYAVDFDTVGLNLYRDGRDSVAWHGDRIARTVPEPIVAITSLGAERRFLLRPTGGGRARRYDLRGGDLLVMGGTSQRTWQHTVPKVARAGARISVTFRHSTPAATAVSTPTVDGGAVRRPAARA